jgi:hypothetical protein
LCLIRVSWRHPRWSVNRRAQISHKHGHDGGVGSLLFVLEEVNTDPSVAPNINVECSLYSYERNNRAASVILFSANPTQQRQYSVGAMPLKTELRCSSAKTDTSALCESSQKA